MFEHVARVARSPSAAVGAHFDRPAGHSLAGPLIYADRRVLRYGSAIALVLLVAALRFALAPILGTHAVLLPFLLAVLGAAILGGVGPAILATALTPIVAAPLLREASGAIDFAWAGHVALFLVIGGAVTAILHRLQRSASAQRAALVSMWQSQREASRSEAQLRLMADALPVLISYVDAKQRYRFNNSGYEQWLGIKPSELYGRHMQDVWGTAAYEVQRPLIQAALAGNPVDCERRMPYESGARDVRVHLMPDVGPDNVVNGVFALIEDIAERKLASQALLGKVKAFSVALRAAGASTFDWNIDTDTLVWSDGRLNAPRDRDTWVDSIHSDDRPRFSRALERALVDGHFAIDYRVCGKHSGEMRWVRAQGQFLRDAKARHLVGVTADRIETSEEL